MVQHLSTLLFTSRALGFFLLLLAAPAARTQTPATDYDPIATSASHESDPQLKAITSEIEHANYQRAEADSRTYLQFHPNSAAGHNLLGYIFYRENKPRESLAEYTAGARHSKPNANILAVVAMDYILLADYPDAERWLEKATLWEPGNSLYWYYLGRTKYNENRFEEAITAFDRVLKLKPRDIRAEYNLGLAFAGLGQTSEAAVAYKTAIDWEKTGGLADPQPYLNLGLLFVRQGKLTQATTFLVKAVELDEKNPKSHEVLARNYEQLREFGKAESEYKTAVALAPNIPALHFELGRIYQKEKLKDLAAQEFARCAALNQAHSTDSVETPNIIGKHF